MSNNRVHFHSRLTKICPNVYFQSPSNITMKYPCIVYSRKNINADMADNITYIRNNSYTVTVMDKNPDSTIVEKLLDFKYSKFDRQFISDGLNHTVFTINNQNNQ